MSKIREVKPPQIITIDSKLEVREISAAVISRIEHSREWDEHRRTHKNAQLAVKSDAPAELKQSLSKAVRDFYEQFKPEEPVQVREAKPAGMMYGGKTAQGPVHVYSAPSEVSAGCTCGQSFKLDPQGNVVTGKGNQEQGTGGGPGAYSVGAKEAGGYAASASAKQGYAVSGKEQKSLYK
ncbi:hypothetical protein HY642_00515 [Candidatus Woesearchaeota archaeon]|nr:hypothetical protein [Candidatus Woesearchaeota archaeon]